MTVDKIVTEKLYPDYEVFGNLLTSSGLIVSPAEVHGLLSGMLAAGQAHSADWYSPVNDLLNDGQGLSASLKTKVAALNESTYQSMADSMLGFQLFLPDDEALLEDRAAAIAQWVQSFLLGFGILQNDLKSLSEDIQELISDFTDISQLSNDFDEESEENEQALFQVIEYVRIGVITIFAHLASNNAEASHPTLH